MADAKTLKSRAVASDLDTQTLASTIEAQVLVVRGHRVFLAQQLATLYGVETKVLNQAVQRNMDRFPQDFMFRLERDDLAALRSQTVTLNTQVLDSKEFTVAAGLTSGRGTHAKYTSYAFTEQGVAMLSSVLKSERAIAVNVEIMRSFVKLRSMLSEHVDMKRKLSQLEKKYDEKFRVVFDAIHELMTPPEPAKKRRIGFIQD